MTSAPSGWMRVDPLWWMDAKMLRIGGANAGYFLALVGWSKHQRTDGHVSPLDAVTVANVYGITDPLDAVALMVDAGLLDVNGDGWNVTRYARWQESAAEEEARRVDGMARRRAATERQRKWRQAHRGKGD